MKTSMDHAVLIWPAIRAWPTATSNERAARSRTGRIDLLSPRRLVRCAARVASLVFEPCEGFEKLRADAPAPSVRTRTTLPRTCSQDIALLPPQQRAVAASNLGAEAANAVRGDEDPLSRLVAIGVLFQAGVRTDGYRRCRGDCVCTGMAASTVGVAERTARACRQGSGCERKRAATRAYRRGTRRQVEQLSGKCIDVEFKDRAALITGAAGSLGRFVANVFAERGANLVLVGRDEHA